LIARGVDNLLFKRGALIEGVLTMNGVRYNPGRETPIEEHHNTCGSREKVHVD
jgi:hypothetical protein